MASPENTNNRIGKRIESVALLEEYGQLKPVMGIDVDIRDEKYPQYNGRGRYALTREGLIHIQNIGLTAMGNDVDHVHAVTPVDANWSEITKLTGLTEETVTKMFDDYESPKPEREPVEEDPEVVAHWKMMQEAGDYR